MLCLPNVFEISPLRRDAQPNRRQRHRSVHRVSLAMAESTRNTPPEGLAGSPATPSSAAIIPSSIVDEQEDNWRIALIGEARKIETSAKEWSYAYRGRAAFFHAISSYLALGSAVLATAAGGTSIVKSPVAGGVLALAAAVVAAISSTVGATTRTQQENLGAIQNTTLSDAARVFATTVAPFASREDTIRTFMLLLAQRDEVVRKAPVEARGTVKTIREKLIQDEQAPGPS